MGTGLRMPCYPDSFSVMFLKITFGNFITRGVIAHMLRWRDSALFNFANGIVVA